MAKISNLIGPPCFGNLESGNPNGGKETGRHTSMDAGRKTGRHMSHERISVRIPITKLLFSKQKF